MIPDRATVRLVGAVCALAALACSSEPAEVRRFDRATRVLGDSVETRSLPDAWTTSERARFSRGRYGFEFALDAVPAERWAVYLPRADTNASATLNGVPLGSGGRMTPPIARMRNRPLLLPVSSDALHVGVNALEIELAVEPSSSGGLGTVFLGPARSLEPRYAARQFASVTLLQIGIAGAVALAVVVATLFGVRERRASQGWFLAAIALWILYASEVWIRDPILPTRLWEAVANAALYAAVWTLLVAFHRAQGVVRPRIEIGILAAIAISFASLLWIPAELVWSARIFWSLGLCFVAGYLVVFVLGGEGGFGLTLERRHALVGCAGLGMGLHDLVSAPVGHPLLGVWLAPYVGGLTVVVSLGLVLRQAVAAIRESRTLRAGLERRVAERSSELEARYATLRELAADNAVRRERDRLLESIHGGVGATLVSAVALFESPDAPATAGVARIRDALDDLRVLIDSLDPQGGLLDLLAALRARFAPRLERSGVRVEWGVGDVPEIEGFGAEHALWLLRILHAVLATLGLRGSVSTLTVRTDLAPRAGRPGVVVEISDDGGPSRPDGGRDAWSSLQRDATKLGADLEAHGDARGVRVRLWLPTRLTARAAG